MTIQATPPRQYQGFVTLQLTRKRKDGRETLRMAGRGNGGGGGGGVVTKSINLQEFHLNLLNKHTMT